MVQMSKKSISMKRLGAEGYHGKIISPYDIYVLFGNGLLNIYWKASLEGKTVLSDAIRKMVKKTTI